MASAKLSKKKLCKLPNKCYKNAGHEMAIVGEPCNVFAHAKIPALFITMLCPCCVYTCTVQLYTLTVTVQVSR